ncbi:sensor histidine kinase [Hoeflea sp. WL0058]|uniref:histidine kinase n=1 Tax=Flavimaribacter sediminis TaxID=2865987 RepID=A0AAE3D3A6_9HYPH|nr:sensor histidine kinase [Flavimaribacter sediminis]MBW8640659.1 sensor histidine kinase [Flavimaribacter sediminis]
MPAKLPDERVLVLAALPADAAALRELIEAEGETPAPLADGKLSDALDEGAGCLIMTEETLTANIVAPLLEWAQAQPEWSVLPVLILVRHPNRLPKTVVPLVQGERSKRIQVTLLGRPSAPDVLRNALRGLMETRRWQYRIRDQIRELQQREEEVLLLGREVQHRARNSITKVLSIMRQTWRSSASPEAFIQSLERRIASMARGLTLMSESNALGASIVDLLVTEVRAVLGEEAESKRLFYEGRDMMLNEKGALALHLVFHELTTNALKYGAFSNSSGCVNVQWAFEADDDGEMLRLSWREENGPPVVPPEKKGFGSRLIDITLLQEVEGACDIDYAKTGLVCTMRLPTGVISPTSPGDQQ